MITNEVQYRATKAHLAQFDEALTNLVAKAGSGRRTKLAQLEIDAVEALASDLRNQIEEYEHLRSGEVSIFEASSLDGLAGLLVRARIARQWSQRDLAAALGVAEQQIQRYESTDYRAASLARICDVADALGLTISERGELRDPNAA
jgi:HTH-type transcriptional regulator/antitoxin HigA